MPWSTLVTCSICQRFAREDALVIGEWRLCLRPDCGVLDQPHGDIRYIRDLTDITDMLGYLWDWKNKWEVVAKLEATIEAGRDAELELGSIYRTLPYSWGREV